MKYILSLILITSLCSSCVHVVEDSAEEEMLKKAHSEINDLE